LNLNAILKTGKAAAGRPRAVRALAIGETACAIVLLTAAGLLWRSFRMVQQVDPGFQPSHLLSAYLRTHYQTPAEGAAFFNEVLDRLAHAPGLQSAAVADCVPAFSAPAASIEFDDRPKDPAKPAVADGCWISATFFTTIGTNLEKGRFFTLHDNASAPPVVIVNKTLAEKYWPGENPLGKRIAVAYTGPGRRSTGTNRFREVVGVVGDLKTRALDVPAGPALYLPFHQDETGHDYVGLHLFVRTLREPVWLADTVRAQVRGVNPNQTIDEMRTLDDVLYANLSQRRFSLGLLGSFALLALTLAAVGIYGTIAFSLSQRTRELGVRVALGATPANLIKMILKEGLALSGAGVVAGIFLSALFTRAMASMLFRVKAVDPITLIAVSLLLIAVAAAASLLPARKAAFANPLDSLRAE
jgi:predicted permease